MTHLCQICKGETRLLQLPKQGDFHWCRQCDFIAKDPAFLPSEKEARKIYDLHENAIDDPRYVAFLDQFLRDAVLDNMGQGKMALDFGSGPSPVLAQILQDKYGFDTELYDLHYATDKTCLEKQYDLITATEVIEHLAHPLPYFHAFKAMLKNEGLLAVMTLLHPNDEAAFRHWHYMRDETHLSFYTLKTFEQIARQVGLRIVYTNRTRYITFAKDPASQLLH